MSEIKKRYIVIVLTLVLVGFIFGDQIFQTKNTATQDAIGHEHKADSLMSAAEEKVKQIHKIHEIQQTDQQHIDSLDMVVAQQKKNGFDTDALKNRIKELKRKQESYDVQLITLMEDTTTLRHQPPHVIHKDSMVYNIIRKDTVIYNIIKKDSIVSNTVYVTDTILVDPKYIKNKFYKQ